MSRGQKTCLDPPPSLRSPAAAHKLLRQQRDVRAELGRGLELDERGLERAVDLRVGFGRIVVLETEPPNMLAITV
jgi:hypothetical protein